MSEENKVSIRVATIADTQLLTELGIRTFTEAFAAMNSVEDMELYLAQTFTPAIIQKEFEEPGSQFFIASVNEQAIGYAKIRWKPLPGDESMQAAEIQRLYVLPSHQNLRVGSMLMDACFGAIRNAGIKTIWLGVWEHNAGAIRLYQRYGFRQFGTHIFQLGNDPQTDHLMKLEIID